jgi:hypothetical protein
VVARADFEEVAMNDLVRTPTLLYGCRTWLGRPAWELALLNNSRRASLRMQATNKRRFSYPVVPTATIFKDGMSSEEVVLAEAVAAKLQERRIIRLADYHVSLHRSI